MSSKRTGILANVLEWDAVAATARAGERDYGGGEADRLGIFTPMYFVYACKLRQVRGTAHSKSVEIEWIPAFAHPCRVKEHICSRIGV